MAISSMDTLVAGITGGVRLNWFKSSTTSQTGGWLSFWAVAGQPGAGATPATGAGEVPDKASAGALHYTNPASGSANLAAFATSLGNAGVVVLYDRLVQTSGLSGTVITAQTVNSVAITRPNANGDDVECWFEVYTATGGTSRTLSVSYTNQAGTAGRTGTATIPASAVAGRIFQMALQAGDSGVRSVETVTLSASTGTAGNFGVTLLRRFPETSVAAANLAGTLDAFELGLPRIYDDACLALMGLCSTTTTGALTGIAAVASG